MVNTATFNTSAQQYDQWFENHPDLYQLELETVKSLLPSNGVGVEIGAGTGRFMGPLEVSIGIEPAHGMRALAAKHGITLQDGVAENLPLQDSSYDYILFITTLCFVDSVQQALQEAHRVLQQDGALIIGMIDRASSMGKEYEDNKNRSSFYQQATFYTIDEMVEMLHTAGFSNFQFKQTLLPEKFSNSPPIIDGYGKGSFVVIQARKSDSGLS